MKENPVYIGIDIGGSKCAVVVGDESGQIIQKVRFDTQTELGPHQTLMKIHDTVAAYIQEYNDEGIRAIGISCGGPLDSNEGIIMSPPNLPGWDKVEIVKDLNNAFQLPVFLQNDANACALAEWRYGAGQGATNMVFLTFGTGMGAGLILNGRLYSGAIGMAGEVGHISLEEQGPVGYGKRGSFEGFCSGGGIAQLAQMKVLEAQQRGQLTKWHQNQTITAQDMALAAIEGDPIGIELFEEVGWHLGKGIAYVLDLLNPDVVVIGSIYERATGFIKPKMEEAIVSYALRENREHCKIYPSKLGDHLGDIAALTVGIEGAKYEFI